MSRYIEVKSCLECPLRVLGRCPSWNSLTREQAMDVAATIRASKYFKFLKTCMLKELEECNKQEENEVD